jgi:3-oxoacyl-[acyl-carrier-protein] synthase-3
MKQNRDVEQQIPLYRAVIAGSGSFAPDKVLTNEDFTKMVDTSDEWITTRTGIKRRHIAADNETTSYLATEASKRALADAKLEPKDLDVIMVATITPEMVFPSTACFVQLNLKAVNAFAFDIAAACSGFIYCIAISQEFIEKGRYENILVIGAETLTKITNYKDRTSCILFGDGAGAVILQRSSDGDKGVLYTTMYSDPNYWEALNCRAYGSLKSIWKFAEERSISRPCAESWKL